MKILVPIDFSDHARVALKEAVAWAAQTKGELVLLHVIPRANWHVTGEAKLRSDLRAAAKQKLEQECQRIVGSQVPSERHVVEGTPHAEITRLAADESTDLIVIATRGCSALERFFLGSTTERVVRTARCPVFVMRDPVGDGGPRSFKRIMIGTDFNEQTTHAIATAVRFAKMSGAELVFTHVLDEDDYPSYQVMSPERWERIRRAAERQLASVQRKSCGESVRSRILLVEGVPSKEINAAAKDNAIDLLVVAPRGGDGHFLGATAERVVRGAPCSVFVAKQR